MKVAIIHYWLVNKRGGERVLEELCKLFPSADIFTHIYAPETLQSPCIAAHKVHTSFINKLPFAKKHYQYYLPLMPLALEQLDLRGYDLIISSESGPAKGVITSPNAVHICYCHSPMRYVWDLYHDYMAESSLIKRLLVAPMMHYLRIWDALSAHRVDAFVANSAYVAKRIHKCYRRTSRVVHPPVTIDAFHYQNMREDFYLYAGELAQYKRPDIAVEACNKLGKKLVVIGGGAWEKKLRAMAGPTVQILGRQPFDVLVSHYSRCRALLFPATEDFGITPLEAMASGAPVLAYAQGGALETVVDGKTGLFFHEQNATALAETITRFEQSPPAATAKELHAHAAQWDTPIFAEKMKKTIEEILQGKREEER